MMDQKYIHAALWSLLSAALGCYAGLGIALDLPLSGENTVLALQFGIVSGGVVCAVLCLILAFLKKGAALAIALASAAAFGVSIWFAYDFARIIGSV